MAAKVQTGQFAKVVLTVNAVEVVVMKLRNWSYSSSVEEIDSSAADQEWSTVEGGLKGWEGEAEIIDVDTFYIDHLGDKATIKFYGHKDDTKYEEGKALITGVDKSASYDDLVSQSLTFKGDGALEVKGGVI